MKLNTPNKLTILRICMIPLFIFFLLFEGIPFNYLIALAVFAIASLTDMLDGHLARKHNLITNFGKFLDPLADKMLVTSALICFIELDAVSSIVVVIIIAREFLVTSLRLIAAAEGKVIAAGLFGKIKTCAQIGAIIITMLLMQMVELNLLGTGAFTVTVNVIMWLTAAVTVASGIQYLWDNRSCINTEK